MLSLAVRPATALDLALTLQLPGGRFAALPLKPAGTGEAETTLPSRLAGARVTGLRATRPSAGALSSEHQSAEGGGAPAPTGTIVVGRLTAGAETITDFSGWRASGALSNACRRGTRRVRAAGRDARAAATGRADR
jgi:hypothetical protein